MPALSTPHSQVTAPFGVPMPEHWAFDDDISVLPRIFEDSITLAVMRRELSDDLRDGIAAQLAPGKPLDWHWRGAAGRDLVDDLARRLPALAHGEALLEDVRWISEAMAFLFDTDTVGVRLRILDVAMCPRFHVDNLAVRLVTTYAGPGSEWLPETAVERHGLGAPHPGKPDAARDVAAIERLNVGDLALLKGEGWIGNEGRGLVHRSPQPANGDRRLLLALDPG